MPPVPHECPLCRIEYPLAQTSEHHLTPASRGGRHEHKERICNNCHRQIHALFTNKELERVFDSLGSLRNAGPMRRYLKWAKKHGGSGKIRALASNRKRQKLNRNTREDRQR